MTDYECVRRQWLAGESIRGSELRTIPIAYRRRYSGLDGAGSISFTHFTHCIMSDYARPQWSESRNQDGIVGSKWRRVVIESC